LYQKLKNPCGTRTLKETDKIVDYRSFSIFSSGCKQPNLSTVNNTLG